MPSLPILEPCAVREEKLSFFDGLLVACICLIVSFGALASLPRAQDETVPLAIVFPPWVSGSEAVALSFAAGYQVLRSGRLSSVVVVAPAASAGELRPLPKNAWFSLALAGLAGCLDAAGGTGSLR